jgi:hypothetical protein
MHQVRRCICILTVTGFPSIFQSVILLSSFQIRAVKNALKRDHDKYKGIVCQEAPQCQSNLEVFSFADFNTDLSSILVASVLNLSNNDALEIFSLKGIASIDRRSSYKWDPHSTSKPPLTISG